MTKVRWHLKHEQFGTKPWAVQAEGMRRAEGRERFGHFMEQGLGKTALNLNEFVDANNVDLNIVIAPNSFMGDWPIAPAEWGLGFMKTGMWPRDPMPYDWDCGLYVVGHETLRGSKRARDELSKLIQSRRVLFTIDESTGIKNPQAELTRYVLQVVKDADMVRELNGTPLVLNVMDYWPQLRVLGELNGVNPYQFRNRFAVMGGYMGRQIKGIKNEEELGRLIDSCTFRALVKDWRKDLPPSVPIAHHYEMTDNQRKHYDTMMDEFYVMVSDADVVTADMVLTQRIKLRQISSCLLMDGDKVHWLEPPNKNPKLRAIKDLFDYTSCKALVPYWHRPSGAMLFDELKKAGLNPAAITGKMKPADIVEQKAKFNKDPSCRVLVGQIDQTSRGHTLLGEAGKDRCDRTFYYENSLALMHRSQMDFRNRRGAQDQTTYLVDFVGSPVEQLDIDILTGKKALGDGIDAMVAEVRRKRK